MKKIYLMLVGFFAVGTAAMAQCGGRYDANVYSAVTATTGIVYGSNVPYNSSTPQNLTLDFYEPTGDTSNARPLIIWAHGGSFLSGSSTDADVDTLCHRFAKKGYACASINYRIGVAAPDSLEFIKAVLRAVQDMKASVRFFYKDRLTTNTYKIDTNNIFIAGSSAGAFMALHYAYLKRSCQITTYMSQATLDGLGGLDGYSGNQCYSQKFKGVINLCGALGTYGWLEAGDVPLVSMHGTSDGTVNYNRGNVLPTFPVHILVADGSRVIYDQAQTVGVQNPFYTWYGADHVPYAGGSAVQMKYMDTTVNFVNDFLLQRLGYSCPPAQVSDAPFGSVNLYSFTNCSSNLPLSCYSVGIQEQFAGSNVKLFPNPASQNMTIEFGDNESRNIQLIDASGRTLRSGRVEDHTFIIERNGLPEGIYLVKVIGTSGSVSTHKIIFN